MEFDPHNPVVQLCLQGMNMEAKQQPAVAGRLFLQAWSQASNDFEKYLAAYYVARQQQNIPDKLSWLQTAIQYALKTDTAAVKSALPALHHNIAQCYEALNDTANVKQQYELAASFTGILYDSGPFYHGTRADLQPGDLLLAGGISNYNPAITMNHIYFTAGINGAGLAAALAKGDGRERVYIVEPTGTFENDPNVTDKKFPGNPTRSYRSLAPLKIVDEVADWVKITPEQLLQWKEKLSHNKGEIIN